MGPQKPIVDAAFLQELDCHPPGHANFGCGLADRQATSRNELYQLKLAITQHVFYGNFATTLVGRLNLFIHLQEFFSRIEQKICEQDMFQRMATTRMPATSARRPVRCPQAER